MSLPQPNEDSTEPFYDSAIEDDGSSTQSLVSEVYDHQFENGRRYHGYHADKYPFPNDKKEQKRLDLMHDIYRLTLNNKLVLHPATEPGGRVLDLGTGTGIWAIDYADRYPDSHVLGVDLSPNLPEWVPPNCTFVIDDIEEEWLYGYQFREIFCRDLLGSIADWKAFFRQAYDNLEPGGYFEIQNLLYTIYRNDGNSQSGKTFLHDWSVRMVDAARRSGRPIDVASHFENLLKDSGFDEVTADIRPIPIGGWPKDKKLRSVGSAVGEILTQHLKGISCALFYRHLKWTSRKIDIYLAQVRREVREHKSYPSFAMYTIWGRKPEYIGP